MSLLSRAVVGGAGLLITGASSTWGAFKFVEWAFGLATMPGNIDETESTLAAILKWLLQQDPNVAVLVAVGMLFLFGLYMMAWAIRRTQPAATSLAGAPGQTGITQSTPDILVAAPIPMEATRPAPATPESATNSMAGESAEERQAKHELAVFVANHFLPAFRLQQELHGALLDKACGSAQVLRQLAHEGLYAHEHMVIYCSAQRFLAKAVEKNMSGVSLPQMMKKVNTVASLYEACYLFLWTCNGTNIDYKNDPSVAEKYRERREKSDELENAYRPFRQRPVFSSLYKVDTTRRMGEAFAADL